MLITRSLTPLNCLSTVPVCLRLMTSWCQRLAGTTSLVGHHTTLVTLPYSCCAVTVCLCQEGESVGGGNTTVTKKTILLMQENNANCITAGVEGVSGRRRSDKRHIRCTSGENPIMAALTALSYLHSVMDGHSTLGHYHFQI